MFLILVLILMSSQINCNSICETIKPNGVFNGLQIYRKYAERFEDSLLMMNNRNGTEWQFDITFDGELRMNDSMVTTNVSPLYRFGNFGKCFLSVISWYSNCMVFAANASHLEVKCPHNCIRRRRVFLPISEYVPINQYIRSNDSKQKVLLFDRKAKLLTSYLIISIDKLIDCISTEYIMKMCAKMIPKYITQMNETLFSQLEGEVDFNATEKKDSENILLLFRIDGRPKYCITSIEELSPECTSSENMKTLFEECFEKKQFILNFIWVVFGLMMVITLITFGIIYMYLRRRRKRQLLKKSKNKTKKKSTKKSTQKRT